MHSATRLRRPRSAIHLLICLLLILAGAIGASLIQTGGGHIAVQGLKIPGKDGTVVSADPVSYTHLTLPTNREV